MADDTEWLTQRLQVTETAIIATESAILALVGGAQSYMLDTGQTRRSVTKAELGSLRVMLDSFEERRKLLRGQLGLTDSVSGSVYVFPDF